MIKGSVKVTKNSFGAIGRELSDKVAAAVGETVFDLESEIKQNIVAVGAVDTGLMLNSVQGIHDAGSTEGMVVVGVDYWVYPNYGTATQPARPFVEPAVDTVQPRHSARVRKAIGE